MYLNMFKFRVQGAWEKEFLGQALALHEIDLFSFLVPHMASQGPLGCISEQRIMNTPEDYQL